MESFMVMYAYQSDKLNLTRGTIITVDYNSYDEVTYRTSKFHYY